MGKINFTKENLQQLRDKVADSVLNGTVFYGSMGQGYSIQELLQNTSINTIKNMHSHVATRLEKLAADNSWGQDSHTEEIEELFAKKETLNLVLGYLLKKAEDAQVEAKKNILEQQLKELKDSTKTPEEKIKELEAQLQSL